MNKPHKSKISKIVNDVFEIGAVKHASQFTKSLKNIADYAQIKYNNDVAEAIRIMEQLYLTYPEMPQPIIKKDETGKEVELNPSKAELFMWKRLLTTKKL